MDSFFIITDNVKTTHCAGREDKAPIISAPTSAVCGPDCDREGRLGHHKCAAIKINTTSDKIRYCECTKNTDEDKHGRKISHYFSMTAPKDIGSLCICYWCENNCKYRED